MVRLLGGANPTDSFPKNVESHITMDTDEDDECLEDDLEIVEPYDVGYASPPKAHQFKPRQSGNPNGRPVGSKSFDSILIKVMGEKRAYKDGHKTTSRNNLELLIKRISNSAVKRDRKALALWEQLQGMDQLEELPAQKATLITSEEMDQEEWDSRYAHLGHAEDGSDCDASCEKSKYLHRFTHYA